MGEVAGAQRRTEEGALSFRAVLGTKKGELFLCFDALSDHELFEVLAHINYGAHDRRVIRIAGDLLDKGLVNLENVNGKLSKIAEAGITGAEIIYRQVYPNVFQLSKN